MNQTISVDFDGVIHSYRSPWEHAEVIPDPPVDGAFDWLARVMAHYLVVISSVRAGTAGGRLAIRRWFTEHGFEKHLLDQLDIMSEKPKAILYIDDRGFHFKGVFPEIEEIATFRPWNR